MCACNLVKKKRKPKKNKKNRRHKFSEFTSEFYIIPKHWLRRSVNYLIVSQNKHRSTPKSSAATLDLKGKRALWSRDGEASVGQSAANTGCQSTVPTSPQPTSLDLLCDSLLPSCMRWRGVYVCAFGHQKQRRCKRTDILSIHINFPPLSITSSYLPYLSLCPSLTLSP